MNGGGVSEIQHSKLITFIGHDPSIPKVNFHGSLIFGAGDIGDVTHVAVADLLVVLDLHDLITKPETQLPGNDFGLSRSWRVYQCLQSHVHCVHGCFGLVPEGSQECHTVHTKFTNFLHIQVFDNICGYGKVLGIEEHEIRSVLHTEIAMLDQSGVRRNPAAGTLTEYMVQTNHGDSAAFDDVF